MTHIAILMLSLVGFALMLLASPRHRREWLPELPGRSPPLPLRLAGLGLLALAFALAGAMLGWGYGSVAWCGWLTASAALIAAVHAARMNKRQRTAKVPR